MSPGINALVAISMAGLLLVSALSGRRTGEWRMFIALVAWVAALVFLLNRLFGFPGTPAVAMGLQGDTLLWVALYICMALGMFAHYAYRHFGRPRRSRPKWDWGLFFAPVFASPMVFIPLATSFNNAGLDLQSWTTAKSMIFLVAFQNGFFWQAFFEPRHKEGPKLG